jgi:hypothetical protein
MDSRIRDPRADSVPTAAPSQETIRFGYAMATIALTTALVIVGALAFQRKPAETGALRGAVQASPLPREPGGLSGQGTPGQAGGKGSRGGDPVVVSGSGEDPGPWSLLPFVVVPGVWLAYLLGRSPRSPGRGSRRGAPTRIDVP